MLPCSMYDELEIQYESLFVYVSGSSKIQTLYPMTQVLLKLRFTPMERLSGYFLYLQMCRYMTN